MLRFLVVLTLAFKMSVLAQSGPIQDNSFLVEEAYNQEAGVVQHICSFTALSNGAWAYTFTQEWPVPRHEKHQLSYTVGSLSGGESGGYGFGDTLLNYRYQLIGNGQTRVAVAPRVSLVLPTGSSQRETGFGGTGVQINIPVSITLSRHFVSHWNLGTTLVPHASDGNGAHAFVHSYNAAQSIIWLARPRFNVMLEVLYMGNESVIAPQRTSRSHDLYVSPGIRWAHNLSHGLQVVPGIGVPMGGGPSSGQKGLIVYLSLEHPLWREAR
jgi:hypothetical protein